MFNLPAQLKPDLVQLIHTVTLSGTDLILTSLGFNFFNFQVRFRLKTQIYIVKASGWTCIDKDPINVIHIAYKATTQPINQLPTLGADRFPINLW